MGTMPITIPTFPALVGLIFPAKRSPMWNTDVARTVTGRRSALANFSYPIWKYELAYEVLRSDITNKEFQTLAAFYNRVNGPAGLWQFTDPNDFAAAAQGFGVGDGSSTMFQLVRAMTGQGANAFVEPVWAPQTATIFVDDVENNDVTISDLGLVTFNDPPAADAVLTWTGTFNWLCRFDDDELGFDEFASKFFEAKKVNFSTEKP